MNQKLIIGVISLSFFSTGLIFAQETKVQTSVSSSAPTTSVEIKNEHTIKGGFGWSYWAEDKKRDVGQSFTVMSDFKLSSITFPLVDVVKGGENAADAEFTLKLVTFSNSSATTPASTVATFTGTMPAADALGAPTKEAPIYLTFTIPPTALKAGTTYGVIFHFNSAGKSRSVNFGMTYGNSYPDGSIILSPDGGSTYSGNPNDYIFYVQKAP